jgi:hypothetical protein
MPVSQAGDITMLIGGRIAQWARPLYPVTQGGQHSGACMPIVPVTVRGMEKQSTGIPAEGLQWFLWF